MKKLFGLLLALPILLGLTIHFQFPATVAWDPAVGATSYEVYLAPPGDKGAPALQTEVTQPEVTFQQVPYGEWAVGVRSVKTEGPAKVYSAIAWSDDPQAAPVPFTLKALSPPAAPGNFRVR